MSRSVIALNSEWSLLLAACSTIANASPDKENLVHLPSLLQNPLRWDALFTLADQHAVTPILYHSLSHVNGIPPSEIQALQQRYQTNLRKALLIARELIRVLDCLSELNIEVMPYKGVALAESMYGDIALRQPGDIDLLIRANDFARAKNAVAELGYMPHLSLTPAEELAYLRSGYECAFDSPAGRNLLEMQWDLQPRFYAVDLDMGDLFRRAVEITVAGRQMKTPSPEDLLLILSIHAAKHEWERLIWLCDIAQIAKLPGLNWTWIENQARGLGVARILRVTMLLVNRFLGFELPVSITSNTFSDSSALALVDEIYERIISGASLDLESIAYFRLMLRLRERKTDRLKFLQRLTFTPGPGEWKAVHLPAPLFPLYRLVRLSRLAARLARA